MNAPADLKSPPHSLEAEQSVLGGLMLDPAAWDRVGDRVAAEDFYVDRHRRAFGAIAQLACAGTAVDLVTVAEWLEQRDELERAGGLPYLNQILEVVPSAANIESYATIVRERAVVRRLMTAAQEVVAACWAPAGRSVGDLLDLAQAQMLAVGEAAVPQGGPVPLAQVVPGVLARVDELSRAPQGRTPGLSTGFRDLDQRTNGLFPGDLIVLAGRPSMGKSTLALQMAHATARRPRAEGGGPALFFALEQDGEQLTQRLLAIDGTLNLHRIRGGELADGDWPSLADSAARLTQAPLWIDDEAALSPEALRNRARRVHRECGGLALVVVDYLQLMHVPGMRGNERVAEVAAISRAMKALAKELHVPVVALSQLNRDLERRPAKRPMMADLRESGAIEQDADLIMFLYRDEVYHPGTPDAGKAEVIVAKQRNGPTGTEWLRWVPQVPRLEDLRGG